MTCLWRVLHVSHDIVTGIICVPVNVAFEIIYG